MPVSKQRKNHKQRSKARTQKIQDDRNVLRKHLIKLQQKFAEQSQNDNQQPE